MKTNTSHSAPLTPLAPPAGITGTTLPDDLTEDEIALAHVQSWPKTGIPDFGTHLDSPVKDTPTETGPWGIPLDFPVRPLAYGEPAKDRYTCGHCGLSWDDGIATAYTPAPSGRCPFEAFHKYDDDDEITAPASLVDSVGMPARSFRLELLSQTSWAARAQVWEEGNDLPVAMFRTVEDAETFMNLYASHAAKDAKIRALEEAGKNILLCMEARDGDSLANAAQELERALALPCAPLGS